MDHPFQFFLWVIFPYLMLGSFFIGTIVRFAKYHYTVTSESSELMEKKQLMVGSILFHVGIILVFFGHVAGILVPKSVTEFFGVSNEVYHMFALIMGGLAGTLAFVGMCILTYRRFSNVRVHLLSSTSDLIVNVSLLVTIILGLSASFIAGPTNPSFDYRDTLAVWFRQIFTFHPDYRLMLDTPLLFKIHVICGFSILGFFPYTRLVHALALPWQYIYRRFIVYRKKPAKN